MVKPCTLGGLSSSPPFPSEQDIAPPPAYHDVDDLHPLLTVVPLSLGSSLGEVEYHEKFIDFSEFIHFMLLWTLLCLFSA